MDKIAAVVPTYNRKKELRDCLKALVSQTRSLDAIIIIDNGSTDGTADMLAAEFPQVRSMYVPEPCGSAGGFNKGIDLAYHLGYDWIWLMDNDAVPASDALELLVCASQSVDGRVFNSLVVTPDGENINWGYNLYHGDRYQDGSRLIRTVAELTHLGKPILNGMAQFYTGSLIHRSVIDAVGLPTPGFFTRGDEVDYVLRTQEAGYKTYTVLESRVIHPPETFKCTKFLGRDVKTPMMPPWKQYYAIRNDLIIARRFNFAPRPFPFYYLRLFLSTCGRCLVLPDQRLLRLLYTLWGFLDGALGRLYVNSSIKVR
jgi:GT2 family glycosyltransferase